jgi:hypothetical protein
VVLVTVALATVAVVFVVAFTMRDEKDDMRGRVPNAGPAQADPDTHVDA